jgi:uncharacterized protein YjiS (DUF1127 family)
MPVAKHLSYATSRSRAKRPRRIDGYSSAHLYILSDEAPCAGPQSASSQEPAIAAAAGTSRSVFGTAAQCAEASGDILWAIASWVVTGMLDGCAAYAFAMYGIPDAIHDEQLRDPTLFKPCEPPGTRSRPALQVIAPDRGRNIIRAAEILSPPDTARPSAGAECAARSGQTSVARSRWRTAIALAFQQLSRIRKAYARHRAIAELESLDDRSLRDMGICRADIAYIARCGARPE